MVDAQKKAIIFAPFWRQTETKQRGQVFILDK